MGNETEQLTQLIAKIEAQEARLLFSTFTNADAWRLGCALVERATVMGAPITLDIGRGEQQLFHCALAGTNADNDHWIGRKNRLVRRYGVSSFLFGRRLALSGQTFTEATGLDDQLYAAHGGAFPINIKGVGPIGTVAVSGLPQEQDHQLLIEVLTEFLG